MNTCNVRATDSLSRTHTHLRAVICLLLSISAGGEKQGRNGSGEVTVRYGLLSVAAGLEKYDTERKISIGHLCVCVCVCVCVCAAYAGSSACLLVSSAMRAPPCKGER